MLSLTTTQPNPILSQYPVATIADRAAMMAADRAAAGAAFADYLSRKAERTVKSQAADLATFAEFLSQAGMAPAAPELYQTTAEPWAAVSWGMVAAFVQWQLRAGYATATIGRKLSTVKVYARLATQAGAMAPDEYTRIKTVRAYAGKEADRIDARRKIAGADTRIGTKKAQATKLTRAQSLRLKEQPDTPLGRRDRLLVCLMLDHGLRVSEVALLAYDHFDMIAGVLRFYRPKVDKRQAHLVSDDTLRALEAYIEAGGPVEGPLWRQGAPGGQLGAQGLSIRAIGIRVRKLGQAVGAPALSPHDLRHAWATYWAGKVDLFRLQEAGGWSSLEMPRRYTDAAEVANTGMV